jgi:hypothetical protein
MMHTRLSEACGYGPDGSVKLLRVLVKWVDEQPSLALPWLPVSA